MNHLESVNSGPLESLQQKVA